MIDPGKALEIARINLLRQVRDRTDLFFVFVLPTLIIVALGLQFGGSGQPRLGVVAPADDPSAAALLEDLPADELEVRSIADEATLRSQVEHGELDAGIVIPDGFDAALRAGRTPTVLYVGTADPLTMVVRTPVEAAIARLDSVVTAARVAAAVAGVPYERAATAAGQAAGSAPGVAIDVTRVGEPGPFAGFGVFTLGASTQLVLFMFLTSLTAATRLVTTRQLGVARRMIASPTSGTTILVGEALGRYAIALLQAVYIVAVSAIVFGVAWGDPLAAGAIIALFGLVCAAAAMLVGAVARNADQAGSIGVLAGLALGALGGCMVPYQMMPASMQAVARLLPHSWAVLGLQSLVSNAGTSASAAAGGVVGTGGIDADLVRVGPNLAVLAGYAAVLTVLAVWRFRRAVTATPR